MFIWYWSRIFLLALKGGKVFNFWSPQGLADLHALSFHEINLQLLDEHHQNGPQ
jgi:hypothetical protein